MTYCPNPPGPQLALYVTSALFRWSGSSWIQVDLRYRDENLVDVSVVVSTPCPPAPTLFAISSYHRIDYFDGVLGSLNK